MSRRVLTSIFLVLFLSGSYVTHGQFSNVWSEIKTGEILKKSSSRFDNLPESYLVFGLNITALETELRYAPTRDYDATENRFMELVMPSPGGGMELFLIQETPVMEEQLQARYANLKSYSGYQKNIPAIKVWFTVSPYGFSGVIDDHGKITYIDQLFDQDISTYIMYAVDTYANNPYTGLPLCGVEHDDTKSNQAFIPFSRNTAEVEMRVYRLAMACTGEWGRAASRGTVEKCLSDMNIMVTRLTQIYESELAIRFVLVNDNDKIVFIDPNTDPYVGSDMARTILPTNTGIINERIGANNYDVGHVLSICFDVGGVAQLGSACQSNKGNGVTCFNNNNFEYAVASIMAHEVGHQFDATHTFNSCAPSQDNASPGSAYEPGSGTTIMSYGGLCGIDNIFGGSDAYFHVASLEQILAKSLPGGDAYGCAQKIPSNNNTPTIIIPEGGFTIPRNTPFELTAEASDENGDNLTYRWEQYNLGPQSTLGSPIGNAPLFRSFQGTPSPTRFFPTPSKIFKNQFNSKEEILPSISRNLKFKCVVKDNKPQGVGIVWDEISFEVTENAGPFNLTYPKVDGKFDIGDEITVTWDVANTDIAPVNCKSVDIYVSINEALKTGDANLILVAKEVPNIGSRKIIIPNKVSNKVNFVIKASDNIFLSTSVLPSIIQTPAKPSFFMDVADDVRKICLPASPEFIFTTESLAGLTDTIRFEIIDGLVDGSVATFSKVGVLPGETSTLTINMENVEGKGLAEIAVRAYVPGVDTIIRNLRINYTATNLEPMITVLPANGTTGGGVLPTFTWQTNTDATSYKIQLASNPSFSQASMILESTRQNVTSFSSSVILDKSSVYYWRMRAINECKEGAWSEIKAFSTEALSCKEFKSGELAINISASGRPTVETSLNINVDGIVNDLNVTSIRCDHQRNGDIIASLISPSNKEIILWNKKCGTQKNIVLGLDDESPLFFGCPLNNSRVMKPENKLSGFQGESANGTWTLRIKDDIAGEGGRLTEFNMEICSNVAVAAPTIVANRVLQIPPGDKPAIRSSHLLAEDVDNPASQLIYTLVSLPSEGNLFLNGQPLQIGSTFTQQDINDVLLKYVHLGSSNPIDQFDFTIIDGNGGWVPITTFHIEVNESFPSKTKEVTEDFRLTIYPNPAGDEEVTIEIGNPEVAFDTFIIFDAQGKKILEGQFFGNKTNISVSTWMPGFYTVRLIAENKSVMISFIKK